MTSPQKSGRRSSDPIARQSRLPVNFFNFQLSHILIGVGWLTTVVWGYSDLNSRVKNIETTVSVRGIALEGIRNQTISDSKDTALQLSALNSKIEAMGRDVEWIKDWTKRSIK